MERRQTTNGTKLQKNKKECIDMDGIYNFFFKEEQTVKKTVTIKKRKTKDLKYDKKYFQL